MEDMYLAMGEQDLETPLLGAFEQPSRVWNFFSSFWSGNNAEPVLIVPPEAVEMGSINELPVSTQRLFQAASEDLPVELYVPPSPLGEGIHPVQIAQVESATDAMASSCFTDDTRRWGISLSRNNRSWIVNTYGRFRCLLLILYY